MSRMSSARTAALFKNVCIVVRYEFKGCVRVFVRTKVLKILSADRVAKEFKDLSFLLFENLSEFLLQSFGVKSRCNDLAFGVEKKGCRDGVYSVERSALALPTLKV